jgi:tetratricopeptide (TPR) repeat protein
VASLAAIVLSAVYLWWEAPPDEAVPMPAVATSASPPPAPRLTHSPSGGRIAQLDLEELGRWCADHGLPPPPPIRETEPAVAQALLDALWGAARQPGAATLGRLGMVCESLLAHECAEVCLQRAQAADPTAARWPYYLGCIYHHIGRSAQAVEALNRAAALDDGYAMTHGRLAFLHLDAGRDELAQFHARRYVTLRPDDSFGHVILARLDLRRGDAAAALQQALTAQAQAPNDFQVHHCLAQCYQALGRIDEARRHFQRCQELPSGRWFKARDPLLQELDAATSSATVLVTELRERHNAGDWPEAVRLAAQILERRPDDALMMTNLAGYYRELRRFSEARTVLDNARRIQPDLLSIDVATAELDVAEGRYGEAVQRAETIVQRHPSVSRAWSVRGRALALQGDYAAAAQAMQRCVELEPGDAGNTLVLAEMHWALGQLDEAMTLYNRVLELSPGQPLASQRLLQIQEQR